MVTSAHLYTPIQLEQESDALSTSEVEIMEEKMRVNGDIMTQTVLTEFNFNLFEVTQFPLCIFTVLTDSFISK